jgi:cytochrome c2
MKHTRIVVGLVASIVAGCTVSAFAQGAPGAPDAARGHELFKGQCGLCHQGGEGDGEGGQGPSLKGVMGRKIGGETGFSYSPALAGAKDSWTSANLDAFLADPDKAFSGTAMPISVPSAADRADIIAYLASLKTAP